MPIATSRISTPGTRTGGLPSEPAIRRTWRGLDLLPLVWAAAGLNALLLVGCRSVGGEVADIPELEAMFARAAEAVRSETGARLDGIRLRRVTLPEMADSISRETLGDAAFTTGKDDGLGALAGGAAPSVVARYSIAENAILIRPGSFAEFAEVLGIPEVDSPGQVMSVLLHELVHAADEELYGCASTRRGLRTADAGRAYNAVLEGHAQLVARRLAEELGLAGSFEVYTRSLSAAPRALDASGIPSGPSALVATIYEDGESFVEALHRDGGDDAVRRAFSNPPADLSLISHPEWFLHPEARPRPGLDLAAGLDVLAGALTEDWLRQQASLSEREFAAKLALLEEQEIAPIAGTLRQARRLRAVLGPSSLKGEISLTLLELDSAEASTRYVEAYFRARKLRDEARKQGSVRTAGAVYETLSPPDPSGVFYEKTIVLGNDSARMRGLCLVDGRVVAELVVLGVAWDRDLVFTRMQDVLRRLSSVDSTLEAHQ